MCQPRGTENLTRTRSPNPPQTSEVETVLTPHLPRGDRQMAGRRKQPLAPTAGLGAVPPAAHSPPEHHTRPPVPTVGQDQKQEPSVTVLSPNRSKNVVPTPSVGSASPGPAHRGVDVAVARPASCRLAQSAGWAPLPSPIPSRGFPNPSRPALPPGPRRPPAPLLQGQMHPWGLWLEEVPAPWERPSPRSCFRPAGSPGWAGRRQGYRALRAQHLG